MVVSNYSLNHHDSFIQKPAFPVQSLQNWRAHLQHIAQASMNCDSFFTNRTTNTPNVSGSTASTSGRVRTWPSFEMQTGNCLASALLRSVDCIDYTSQQNLDLASTSEQNEAGVSGVSSTRRRRLKGVPTMLRIHIYTPLSSSSSPTSPPSADTCSDTATSMSATEYALRERYLETVSTSTDMSLLADAEDDGLVVGLGPHNQEESKAHVHSTKTASAMVSEADFAAFSSLQRVYLYSLERGHLLLSPEMRTEMGIVVSQFAIFEYLSHACYDITSLHDVRGVLICS